MACWMGLKWADVLVVRQLTEPSGGLVGLVEAFELDRAVV